MFVILSTEEMLDRDEELVAHIVEAAAKVGDTFGIFETIVSIVQMKMVLL